MSKSTHEYEAQFQRMERTGKIWTGNVMAFAAGFRGIFAIFAIIGLTGIAIFFNFQLGSMTMAHAPEYQWLFGLGYALLDCAMIYSSGWLAIKGRTESIRSRGKKMFIFLIGLSFWACMTYIVAQDHRAEATGDELNVYQIRSDIADLATDITVWQDKKKESVNAPDSCGFFDRGCRTSIDMMNEAQDNIDELKNQRIDLIKDLKSIESDESYTADHLIIYQKIEENFGADKDVSHFIGRVLFAIAMLLSPLMLIAMIVDDRVTAAAELAESKRRKELDAGN